jgi:hypothetical protein
MTIQKIIRQILKIETELLLMQNSEGKALRQWQEGLIQCIPDVNRCALTLILSIVPKELYLNVVLFSAGISNL